MAPRGETKKRMVAAAGELLRRHGYHGTALNQVLDASGAPRGSLYFHFPGGKQELAAYAIDVSGRAIGRAIDHVLESTEDAGEAIARMVELAAAELRDSGFERGCPVGTVAMDASLTSEPVRAASAEALGGWVDAIERRLVGAGWKRPAARDQALLVLSALEGALLLARAQRDTEPL